MCIYDEVLHCKGIYCTRHKHDIDLFYAQLIDVWSPARIELLLSSQFYHSEPGYNNNIKYLFDNALLWHYFLEIKSRPGVANLTYPHPVYPGYN